MAILSAILCGVALKGYSSQFRPLAVSYQNTIDSNGICRQSSADTCSAAALATLFLAHGIQATEQEMIGLARTQRNHGTNHLGLYRALFIKSRDRKDLVPRLRKIDADTLIRQNIPAVVTVGLPRKLTPEARAFGEKYNWQPGILHDVVFLGPDPDRAGHVLIGEPDYGLESWEVESFRFLYYGFAAWLAPRG